MAPSYSALDLALTQVTNRPWQPLLLAQPVPVEALPTPALVLDAEAFERNLARMAMFLAEHGKGFRPHAKTHKCPLIAARQLEAGAVGVCAAKLSEAAVLVGAGIGRVLITSPLVSADKVRLLARLAGHAEQLDIVVDSERGLDLLADAADPDRPLGVLIDVDVAMGRTGTRSLDHVMRLAERAEQAPGLRFRGIQHYAGHVMHVQGFGKRRDKSLRLWETVAGIVDALSERGLAPQVVTGGGTGTYDIDCEVPVVTDLQVGSYIFMDHEYRLIGGRGGESFDDFEVALQVLVTAISAPTEAAVTVDGGYKAFASDSVTPEPATSGAAAFRFAGDEHGVLLSGGGGHAPALGGVGRFVTPHCDPTVNLYDYYWISRGDMVGEAWPIAARGCSW
jgi:3-hydroxy-D-aspartate aldolase